MLLDLCVAIHCSYLWEVASVPSFLSLLFFRKSRFDLETDACHSNLQRTWYHCDSRLTCSRQDGRVRRGFLNELGFVMVTATATAWAVYTASESIAANHSIFYRAAAAQDFRNAALTGYRGFRHAKRWVRVVTQHCEKEVSHAAYQSLCWCPRSFQGLSLQKKPAQWITQSSTETVSISFILNLESLLANTSDCGNFGGWIEQKLKLAKKEVILSDLDREFLQSLVSRTSQKDGPSCASQTSQRRDQTEDGRLAHIDLRTKAVLSMRVPVDYQKKKTRKSFHPRSHKLMMQHEHSIVST